MKYVVAILTILPFAALAAGNSHGGGHGIDDKTARTIMFQAINVVLLIGGLFYFLKDTVVSFFKDRHMGFVQAAEKAQAARKIAQDEHAQIKHQLTKLESTADESVSRAKAEAADLRNQLVTEAQELSKKIKLDAEAAAQLEIEKAKTALRNQMIKEASALAAESMKEKVTTDDHARLQADFIQNMGSVRP